MKDKKMPFIVKEMNFSGNKYEINGIDLTKAQFYIRKNRELFKIVYPGDFTISNEGSNIYLVLTNSAILTDIVSVQVVYFLSITAGEYPTGVDPDINILTSNYNKLVEDFKSLWTYVKDQVFVSDSSLMPLVFPLLSEGETWVFKDGEMRAVLLYDAIEELRKSVEQVRQEIKTELENKINEFTTNITNLISEFRTEIQNIINNFENDFVSVVANSKTEIINLTNIQKTSITELTNNSKTEINTLVTDQKNSITTLVDNSKTDITNTANTQITNITNISNSEKTNITELAEEKKEEIKELAGKIIGFDPDDYYTKTEIDTMLSDVSESINTIFVGNIPLFDGGSVNCTIPRVLENVDKGTLIITVGDVLTDWFDLTFPVLASSETEYYGFFVPADVWQGSVLLLLKTIKQGNDLNFTTINYTGVSEISIKKIRHIK